ncbi:hypothetical protein RJT34_24922 [Clitoria ternatea]|uniref:Uncharacterized protein n=1 Tax=Clitoria ternatea TaxID=43366 RepID=A0AAN9IGD5_CLITE
MTTRCLGGEIDKVCVYIISYVHFTFACATLPVLFFFCFFTFLFGFSSFSVPKQNIVVVYVLLLYLVFVKLRFHNETRIIITATRTQIIIIFYGFAKRQDNTEHSISNAEYVVVSLLATYLYTASHGTVAGTNLKCRHSVEP